MIIIRNIKEVRLSHDFYQLSEQLGYTVDIILDYQAEIQALIELWTKKQFVEIYSESSEQQWGRIKDTNSTLGSSPYYIGLFHSRVLPDDNDPLLLLSFDKDILYIRMFTDHDDLFGKLEDKHKPQILKVIKQKIANLLFKHS